MGNFVLAWYHSQKARSDAIDRQIEKDSRKFRKELKLLLLGMYLPFSLMLCLLHSGLFYDRDKSFWGCIYLVYFLQLPLFFQIPLFVLTAHIQAQGPANLESRQ